MKQITNMKSHTLTKKQIEILILLYRYRYLTTKHLQTLLHHKNPTLIQIWLRSLKEHAYITYEYNRHTLGENNKPALVSLAPKSILVLKKHYTCDPRIIKQIYTAEKRSQLFKSRYLFLADMAHFFRIDENRYFATKNDLATKAYFPDLKSDAYLAVKDKGKVRRYFLEYIDTNMKRIVMKQRIKKYLLYSANSEWPGQDTDMLPNILIVCPDEKRKKALLRFIRSELEQSFEEVSFYIAHIESITDDWIRSTQWQKATP